MLQEEASQNKALICEYRRISLGVILLILFFGPLVFGSTEGLWLSSSSLLVTKVLFWSGSCDKLDIGLIPPQTLCYHCLSTSYSQDIL